MFAVDSVPAILAITRDPFIVYTSNIFAILGLRALYFLLAGVMGMFRYLKVGLCFVLTFVGVKMLISDFYKIPITVSLGIVAGILAASIVASLIFPPADNPAEELHTDGSAAPKGGPADPGAKEKDIEHRAA